MTPRRSSSLRFIVLLAVSALVHGVGLWRVSMAKPVATTASASAPQPLEVTWRTVEVAVAPAPAPAAPAVSRPAVVAPAPPSVPRAVQPVPAVAAAPTPPDAPKQSDRPANDSPLAQGMFALAPTSGFAMSLDAGVAVVGEAISVIRGLERARPQDLVATTAREVVGRGKVERGLVNSYYSELGKKLLSKWDADRALNQGGLKAYAKQFKENTALFGELYGDTAKQFGKTGAPFSGESLPQARTNPMAESLGGMPAPDFAAKKEMGRALQNASKAMRRTTIKVVQSADGTLLSAAVINPSNDPNIDREALADVKAAAASLPVPPAEVAGGREQITSIWNFELVISISPPVPTVTFEFDEVTGFIDPRLPLDRRVYKKVRLVSVD